MEGPIEIKDSRTPTDEPVKSEGLVQSPGSSERSDGATSPPPNCSICLGKLVNTSFTDSCLHQFCFTCLLQWSKIKTECPLCKQTFKSIIHNVRSEEDYDQYHVPREFASQISQPQVMATLDLNFEVDGNWDIGVRRFLYRTTMTGNRRHGVLLNPEQVARREQLPSIAPQVSRDERRRRRANPTDYRRTVYRHGIYATSLPDVFGRFRECSAEYYRRHPRELDRLVPWLNRELQVLLNNNSSSIAYVMRVIMDALVQYDIRSPQFRDLVRPYFSVHTDHFIHELVNYARTNFDLIGYDQSVTYLPQGLSNEYVPRVVSPTSSSSSSSSTSDDSDIRVLEEAIDLRINTELPGVGPHSISMPGPSTVGQAFQLQMTYTVPDILTISSNSSTSDDECEVIGYVKPRHERTPEIIELISSDPEDANNAFHVADNTTEEVPQPSTSHNTKRRSTTRRSSEISENRLSGTTSSSGNTSSDSDSDDSPRRNHRCQSNAKRSSKSNTNNRKYKRSTSTRHHKTSRNLSSSESDLKRRSSRKGIHTRKRLLSLSDSSFHENEKKRSCQDKSKKGKYSTRDVEGMHKDIVKREETYTNDEISSISDTNSETYENKKNYKSCIWRKSKRKYLSSSSSDSSVERKKHMARKEKLRQVLNNSVLKDTTKNEHRHKERRRSISKSSSESSYISEKSKRSKCKRRESQKNRNDYSSQDDSNILNKDSSRNEHGLKTKNIDSISDSDVDRYRSNSQCSNHSNKSYSHWKKAKHKEKCKTTDYRRPCNRTSSSHQSTSNTVSFVASPSYKNVTHTLKHSDSKNNSTYKERYKSHRNYKESRYSKSQSESKSKYKRSHRIRSSSSLDSD